MSETREDRYRRALDADVEQVRKLLQAQWEVWDPDEVGRFVGLTPDEASAYKARTRDILSLLNSLPIESVPFWPSWDRLCERFDDLAVGNLIKDPAAGLTHPSREVRVATLRRLGGAA